MNVTNTKGSSKHKTATTKRKAKHGIKTERMQEREKSQQDQETVSGVLGRVTR